MSKGYESGSGSTALAATMVGALIVGGVAQGFANTGQAHDQVKKVQKTTSKNIRTGKKPVSVLDRGEAIVTLKDGKRVKITNPLLVQSKPHAQHGHTVVLERDPKPGQDLTKGFYGEKGGIADHEKAQNISYSQDGQPVTTKEAIAGTTQEIVTQNQLGQLVVAAGQKNSGEVVGESVVLPPAK